MKTIRLLTALALFTLASAASGAGPLLSENFNSGNGGFTVSTPVAYDGPWVYSAANGSWREDGQSAENSHPNASTLFSPVLTVPNAGVVTVKFTHRYSFEFDGTRWDGGQLLVSVNGGAFTTVPDASFTQNGYGGNTVAANSQSILHGQPAFTAESSGYATGFLTSRAVLGTFNAGDTVRVQFLAASDTNTRGTVPNWEIDSVVVAPFEDVTRPGDPVVATSNNSPGFEGAANAIDDQPTKYLNFDKLNTGFTVTPSVGRTLVCGLTLTSANDAPERDPASYTLEGSDDGVTFTLISSGTVPVFPSRFFKQRIFFANDVPYLKYRLIFPTVADAGFANSMAISEAELLGTVLPADVTQPGDPIVATSNNSPGSEGVANAIDNQPTKYLNFDKLNTGFTVTPAAGLSVLTGLSITSANDAPERDPASYVLTGSNDGSTFSTISSGAVPAFTARFQTRYILFPDQVNAFKIYRLIFPTVANAAAANSMATSEVELLGVPTLVVTNTNDSGTGSLRQALANAAFNPGADTVTFDPALSGATIMLGSEIVINDATGGVTVDATGLTGGVSISGNNAHRIFSVSSGKNLALLGLTLTGGNGGGADGGAILNDGTTTLDRCTLAGNSTGSGGAIKNNSGMMTLTRCTLSGNAAAAAGSGGAIVNAATMTLTQCTLSDNSANAGGAIYSRGTLTLTHCTLSGNPAVLLGGGIYNEEGGALTLTNSIVAENTSSLLGADIYNLGLHGPSTVTRVGANLVQSLYNGFGGADSGPAAINAPPLLAPLDNYGGPTRTVALLPGSPARNAALAPVPTSDQRGFPIVGLPDVGAYEAGTLGTNYNAFIWETLPTGATAPQHATTFDFDGDGATNFDEWLALTNAADPASRFRIVSVVRNAPNLDVTFTSVVNRHYGLEYTSDLISWTIVASGVIGTGSPITITLGPVTGFPRFFVRARVGP